MGRLGKKLEDIFTAITFAEEGEHEEAKRILKESATETLKGKKPAQYPINALAGEEE